MTPDILDSYPVGGVGLALSHRTLWQAAANQGQVVTVGVEDLRLPPTWRERDRHPVFVPFKAGVDGDQAIVSDVDGTHDPPGPLLVVNVGDEVNPGLNHDAGFPPEVVQRYLTARATV